MELNTASGRGVTVSLNNTVRPSGIAGVAVTDGVGVTLGIGVAEAVGVIEGVKVRVGVGVSDGFGVLDGVGVMITAAACDPNSLVTKPKNPRANPSSMRRQPSLILCWRKPKKGTRCAPRSRRHPSQRNIGMDMVSAATNMAIVESIVPRRSSPRFMYQLCDLVR